MSILMFLVSTAVGQNRIEDIVHLEDGTIIHGEVIEYDPKGQIKIKMKGGSLVVHNGAEVIKIEKIKPKEGFQHYVVERPLHLKEKGWYHSAMGGMTFHFGGRGRVGILDFPFGFAVDYSFGYQFNRYFGIGTSIGFLYPASEGFIPVCANFRGYFLKTSANIFYDLKIGYGLAVDGIRFPGTRTGGFHWEPAIGVRFASKRKGHVVLSLGYLMQVGGVQEYGIYGLTTKVGVTF